MPHTTPRRAMNARGQKLAASYQPYAVSLALPFQRQLPHLADELADAALVGLCEAASRWRPGKGTRFATYSRRRIVGAIRDFLRSMRPAGYRKGDAARAEAPGTVSLDAALTVADRAENPEADAWGPGPRVGGRAMLADNRSAPVGAEAEEADELEALLAAVGGPECREVCRLLYRDGLTQAEAARAMGVTESWAGKLHGQALAELRAARGLGADHRPPDLGPMAPTCGIF